MNQRLKRLLGDGPYPFPIDEINNGSTVESYMGQGMIILSSIGSISMPRGSHAHSSYEFLIPLSDMPHSSVEKKVTCFEKDRLVPINAEQAHGPAKELNECRLVGFHIDKEVLNQIAMTSFGKKDIVFENEGIKVGNEIWVLLQMFMEETRNAQSGSVFIQQNIINLIVVNLLRQLRSNVPILITEQNYCERDNINRAISFLREHYNKDFSLEDLAGIANLSPYHFIRIFKKMTGITPYNYLLDLKIKKSKELLQQRRYTITDICFLCGFNNSEHFSSVFKRKVGILPSQYRNYNLK